MENEYDRLDRLAAAMQVTRPAGGVPWDQPGANPVADVQRFARLAERRYGDPAESDQAIYDQQVADGREG